MNPALPVFPSSRAAALARIAAVQPTAYARSRNALDGAVSGLSPYITHGWVGLPEALAGVVVRHPLDVQHKWVYELGWRAFFHHVWHERGDEILASLHEGPLPDDAYARELPDDIREARTGVPVIDQAVRMLYACGWLHNHARMWLASYVVHLRHVHWRTGADWLYGHLLDGDLASNHLSWQWVAGTGSHKPYLFNADNVARYAPASWHSPGSVIDTSYEKLERWARSGQGPARPRHPLPSGHATEEPALMERPPAAWGAQAPDASLVTGRDVWLLHPWSLGTEAPPADAVLIAVCLSDFHQAWRWSARRWAFVTEGMGARTPHRWVGDAASIAAALRGARSVRAVADPHLMPWLPGLARCEPAPSLFPRVQRPCASFSAWWRQATQGLRDAGELLARKDLGFTL